MYCSIRTFSECFIRVKFGEISLIILKTTRRWVPMSWRGFSGNPSQVLAHCLNFDAINSNTASHATLGASLLFTHNVVNASKNCHSHTACAAPDTGLSGKRELQSAGSRAIRRVEWGAFAGRKSESDAERVPCLHLLMIISVTPWRQRNNYSISIGTFRLHTYI